MNQHRYRVVTQPPPRGVSSISSTLPPEPRVGGDGTTLSPNEARLRSFTAFTLYSLNCHPSHCSPLPSPSRWPPLPPMASTTPSIRLAGPLWLLPRYNSRLLLYHASTGSPWETSQWGLIPGTLHGTQKVRNFASLI